ncbi:hypothetical protein F8388_000311 [Cannabis sativa]|uniref:NADP-dependent oxidoreductase domain-containing protein n=1 Tax=Cannabis sativa TaxID=3483 RepID=A0A7J6FN79_CANSA|nr:hypothetical protein F8388_000311 [Cannabis sativa]
MKNDQVRLNCGVTMPLIGLGTYSYQNDRKTTESAIHMALKEKSMWVNRLEFYAWKILNRISLEIHIVDEVVFRNLSMEYLDLYLVHWPVTLKPWARFAVPNEDEFEKLDLESTWAGMQKCLELGLCRSIGVSNFSSKKIHTLLDFASVTPAVNQVEMHPMWRQAKLREVCGDHKIHVSAYSPLGGPGNSWGSTAVIDHPTIQSIAKERKATPPQVALRWGLSKGSSVIVKSFNESRLRENFVAIDLKLDDHDFLQIDKLEQWKIMRGDFLCNDTTSPYKSIQDLWDDEI